MQATDVQTCTCPNEVPGTFTTFTRNTTMKTGYRIVISVFRGTSAGRALSLMASGITCETEKLEKANEIVDDFLYAADAVLTGPLNSGIVLGIINVVDLAEGVITRTKLLKTK